MNFNTRSQPASTKGNAGTDTGGNSGTHYEFLKFRIRGASLNFPLNFRVIPSPSRVPIGCLGAVSPSRFDQLPPHRLTGRLDHPGLNKSHIPSPAPPVGLAHPACEQCAQTLAAISSAVVEQQ